MSSLVDEYYLPGVRLHSSSTVSIIGRCIIISNEVFQDPAKFKVRRGTQFDENVLRETFLDIGFEVEVFRDLRATEMMNVFRRRNVQYYNCLVLCVLTHGARNLIYGTDGVPLNIWSHIITEFCGIRCEKLIGKPKMFLLQACQGSELMSGGEAAADPEAQIDGDLRPECSDCLVALPAPPGFVGLRSPTNGSPLVQTFCKLLRQHHKQHSVLNILTAVNQEISNLCFSVSGDSGKCQPKIEFTLSKELYLRDSLQPDDNASSPVPTYAHSVSVAPVQLEQPAGHLQPPAAALAPFGIQAMFFASESANNPILVTPDTFGWSTGLLFLRFLCAPTSTSTTTWKELRQRVPHSSKSRALEKVEVHDAAHGELLLALTYTQNQQHRLMRIAVELPDEGQGQGHVEINIVSKTRLNGSSSLDGVCYDGWEVNHPKVWICSTTKSLNHVVYILNYRSLKPSRLKQKSSSCLPKKVSKSKTDSCFPEIAQALKIQVNSERVAILDLHHDSGQMQVQIYDKNSLQFMFMVPDIRTRLQIHPEKRRLNSFVLLTSCNWLVYVQQSDHSLRIVNASGEQVALQQLASSTLQDGHLSELAFHRGATTEQIYVEQRMTSLSRGSRPLLFTSAKLLQQVCDLMPVECNSK